jgi:hypothetical protein
MNGAMKGGLMGGLLGGGVAGAVELGKPFIQKIGSEISSRYDPAGYANAKVAEAIGRGQKSPEQLIGDIQQARAEGQSQYTLADAMGDSGDDVMRGVMNSPGNQKNTAADFFRDRQLGQGTRLSTYTREAFNAPNSSAREEALLRTERKAADDINYPAAGEGAGPIHMAPVMDVVNKIRNPSGVPGLMEAGQTAARPNVERAAQLVSDRNSSLANNYTAVLDAKQQIGDMTEEAYRAGRGHEGDQLKSIRSALDAQLEAATGGETGLYRKANDTHARYSRQIDAIPTGEEMFSTMLPDEAQAAVAQLTKHEAMPQGRTGFATAVRRQVGDTGRKNPFADASGPLMNPAFQEKAKMLAESGDAADLYFRRIGRERRMNDLKNASIGGSSTARNLSAQADMDIDPRIALSALSAMKGSPHGILDMIGHAWNWARTPTTGGENVRNEILRTMIGQPNAQGVVQGLPDLQRILRKNMDDAAAWRTINTETARNMTRGVGIVPPQLDGNRHEASGPFSVLYRNSADPAVVGGR